MAVSDRILYKAHRFSAILNHFMSYTDRTGLEGALDKQVANS